MKIPFTIEKGNLKPKIPFSLILLTLLFGGLMLSENSTLQAQQLTVSGTVKDPSGESIPGVNILEKNTGKRAGPYLCHYHN